MNKETIRSVAICHSLFPKTTLEHAMQQLQFVQTDPIRFPARAQDLVLRHRVTDYKLDDIEKHANQIHLEEDFLYAHGYMVSNVWECMHPRKHPKIATFDNDVLNAVIQMKEVHPKDLVSFFGKKHSKNWWGGNSLATKMALDRLHYYGLLRISNRRKGIRIYQALYPPQTQLSTIQKLEEIIMTIVQILAPITNSTLHQALHRIRRHFGPTQKIIINLIQKGKLQKVMIDSLEYILPSSIPLVNTDVPYTVKFLTPFDPLVWDRTRFEHIWGWQYRFEAYTPKEKRVRGYYAMPMLWGSQIIGWTNISKSSEIEINYIHGMPQENNFKEALNNEIESMRQFLQTSK